MQKTRLNLLVEQTVTRIDIFFVNPWRRISLILISLLFGMFMGTAIPTTAGQTASWDLVVAALLLIFTETISMFVYSYQKKIKLEAIKNSPFIFVLNAFKIGLCFSLYLEALKLAT